MRGGRGIKGRVNNTRAETQEATCGKILSERDSCKNKSEEKTKHLTRALCKTHSKELSLHLNPEDLFKGLGPVSPFTAMFGQEHPPPHVPPVLPAGRGK